MKKLFFVFVVTFVGMISAAPRLNDPPAPDMDEDARLTVPELIVKYGYPCETYYATTPDGYILTLHRIPHGKKSNKVSKNVIFLQHGILASSADWIMSGVEKSLAYVLAEEGFDVWMGNARGNKLSRNHTTLNPDTSAEFWQFSWHEIGVTDLPTMIDFVLKKTGQPNLFYAGHSQGTTSFFVMASERPEYNKKIRAQFSLAPIVYMNHMTSPLLKIMAFFDGPIGDLLDLIGINEFLPSTEFLALAGDALCGDGHLTQILCTNTLFAICGYSPQEMNASMLPILTGHTPAGSSTKQMLHYAQEIKSGHFRQYDFGSKNIDKYGQKSPPDYDLRVVTAPVYMFYSHNDWLAAEQDVMRLNDQLPNVKERHIVGDNNFNHLDYMYGIDAKKFVYDKLIHIIHSLT